MNSTHDQLARALDDHPAVLDVDALVASSRHRGRVVRRRRRGAVGAASVAVLAVVGMGASTLLQTESSAPVATDPTSAEPATPTAVAESPDIEDAWAALAALRWALDQEIGGTVSTPYPSAGATAVMGTETGSVVEELGFGGVLTFVDAEGSSEVGLTIKADSERTLECGSRNPCSMLDLPDGSRAMTTSDRIVFADIQHGSNRVELLRPDGVLVSLSSENVRSLANGVEVSRPEPLSTDQLVSIAGLDVWGAELPERFVEEGRVLQQEQRNR